MLPVKKIRPHALRMKLTPSSFFFVPAMAINVYFLLARFAPAASGSAGRRLTTT